MESKLTVEFLKKKYQDVSYYSSWAQRSVQPSCQHGNITVLNDDILKFTEYNYLPCNEEDILDGHYTFFVDVNTFRWIIYQSSYYGSFTYTTPSKDESMMYETEIPAVSKERIEAIIALKLLSAYHLDHDYPNMKGKGLIKGSNSKGSILCDCRTNDWLEEPNEKSMIALKILNNE